MSPEKPPLPFGESADDYLARFRELNEMLAEERERRELFVSAIVHDMRTPLASMQMAVDLLESFGDRRVLREQGYTILRRNITRLSAMAQRLLDVNRISAGETLPLRIEECELAGLIRDYVEDVCLSRRIEGDGEGASRRLIRFEASEEEVHGWWNCEAVSRIACNLVENAIKYGQPPVSVRLIAKDDEVCLQVHNEGQPIPPSGQGRIFECFIRLEEAAQLHSGGWGIGLTLVRGLAEALGGSIELTSSEDEGTTFTVWLPRDSRSIQTGE